MKQLAVVLLSGGLDSCVTAAVARQNFDLALFFLDYGHRTSARERRAFHDIADHYDVPAGRRLAARTDALRQVGGSALTDRNVPVPDAVADRNDVPVTYVPFRNALLLSLGVSWAESHGASSVYLGAVEEDGSGYPDCTQAFCDAFARAVDSGTRPESHIRILTPVIHLKKAQIVRLGVELAAPLHLTWSCYRNSDRACGRCHSCILRLNAFETAGIPDPVKYDS
ncbi:MAG: 7-cyano-7-deazaguanine synthase QueC [Gemmatimonadetes bacterium]|nr:7-cyano-7-deazaguanine synthase QueC [Gemmatimonadota bacterium]MDE3258856.1 7-cyano-7-deazaguanine synthase QueC [Gemmatimonadota bacterium]